MANTDKLWIPNSVPSIRIKFCCKTCFSGGTPSTKNDKYWSVEKEGIPWIASGKLHDCIIDSPTEYITNKGLHNSSTKLVDSGSPVIAMTGATCGNVGLLNIRACTNQSVFSYILNDRFDPLFVYYSLIASRDCVLLNQVGGAQAGINGDICKNIYIPYFPLLKQKRISSYLHSKVSAIDELLQKEEKQIEKLENYRKQFIREYIEKESCKKDVTRVNSVASLLKGPFGSDMKKELFVDKGKNTYKVYIQINCIQNNEKLGDYYISQTYFYQMKRFEVKPNDILISCDGTLGKTVVLDTECEKGVISSSLLRVTPKSTLLPLYFVFYWENIILDDMLKETRNSCLVHLPSASLIGKYKIYVPSLSKQEEMVKRIKLKNDAITELIAAKKTKIEKIKSYKASLINECVLGKRVD